MKLRVTYELNISEPNLPLIPVIASVEGWTPDSGFTAEEYINKFISVPQVELVFQRIIEGAVDRYFGIAGKTQGAAVKEEYKTAHTVVSEFIKDDVPKTDA